MPLSLSSSVSSVVFLSASSISIRNLTIDTSVTAHRPREPPQESPQTLPRPLTTPRQEPARRSLRSSPFSNNSRPSTRRNTPFQPWNPIDYIPRPEATAQPIGFPSSSRQIHSEPRDIPLLTLPEQRQSRGPSPSSLVVERSLPDSSVPSGRTSIALPRNRTSWTASTNIAPILTIENLEMGEFAKSGPNSTDPPVPISASSYLDPKRDPELGHKPSTRSIRSQLPHTATTTSTLTSNPPPLPGSESDPEWGPSHPCFPHPNVHVPLNSPEYASTRIIRIRRDWMVAGDLAPTFSNLYPEILEPWLPETEFRRLIGKLNRELLKAYDPWGWWNWVDAILGMLTGWIWEDFGITGVKRRLRDLEEWIDEWNRGVGRGGEVRVIPLRRTGYLTLDIQIPDPHVAIIGGTESQTTSRPDTGTPRPSPSLPQLDPNAESQGPV
ncbi:MAG: hypothetical protein M1834_000203 [Cirrosporium novae-zelandiae]|nr:MAG: hypothetical protein M1834_000203 [Cirrosporium novae-zelandiae]